MKSRIYIYLLIMLPYFIACSSENKESGTSIEEKKKKVIELKKQLQILENEIASLDTLSKTKNNSKIVQVQSLKKQNFQHFIELQGNLVNESNIVVMPMGGPGQVKQVFVVKGSKVKKGQLLLKLDDTLLQSQIATIKNQLDFANNLYDRQKKLWEQKIVSEVQYLTAQNTVQRLENELQTLNRMLDYTKITAPIDGEIDELHIKIGEMFTGIMGRGEAQLRMSDSKNLKVSVDIPENYLNRIRENTPLTISFKESNQTYNKKINAISKYINPSTRSYTAEILMPNDESLMANQTVLVKLMDYYASNTIVVPINVVQVDENGKYVFVLKIRDKKNIVHKNYVTIKEVFADNAQISKGLNENELLIVQGYQDLYEGQEISIVDEK